MQTTAFFGFICGESSKSLHYALRHYLSQVIDREFVNCRFKLRKNSLRC